MASFMVPDDLWKSFDKAVRRKEGAKKKGEVIRRMIRIYVESNPVA